MPRPTGFGALWLLVGFIGAALTLHEFVTIARKPDVGFSGSFYEPSWWFTQALFPLFFIVAAAVGAGLLRNARWALRGLKVVAPLMLLYATAYTVFGGERAWWWTLIGVAALAFGAWSVVVAFRGEKSVAI